MPESNQQLIFVRDVRYHFANRAFSCRSRRAPPPGAGAALAAAGVRTRVRETKKPRSRYRASGLGSPSRSASDVSSSPGSLCPAVAAHVGSAVRLCGDGGRLSLGDGADHGSFSFRLGPRRRESRINTVCAAACQTEIVEVFPRPRIQSIELLSHTGSSIVDTGGIRARSAGGASSTRMAANNRSCN